MGALCPLQGDVRPLQLIQHVMFKVLHQRANTALLFHLLLLQIPPNLGARFAEALLNHQFYLSFLRVSQLEMLSPLATRASLDVIHLLIRVSLLSALN